MRKKQTKATLLFTSLLMSGFLVAGCTNSDYDFNEIDATIGVGGDGIELPVSSTMDIPLEDVLEISDNSSIKIADNGDYLFQLAGANATTSNPKIDQITLAGQSYNQTISLSASARTRTSRAATQISVSSPKIQMFSYSGHDKAVKSLSKAGISETTMTISLDFRNIAAAIPTIQKAKLTLPGYLVLTNVTANGNGTATNDGSVITVTNINTAQKLQLTIKSNQLLFTQQDDYGKLTITDDGSISFDGYFSLDIDAEVQSAAVSNLSIGAQVNVQNVTLKSATGIFDPEIKFASLGDVAVNDIPDFLSDDEVRADLDNPQIKFTVQNDMDVAADISASVISTKAGQTLATVQLPEMRIYKNSDSPTTTLCICRKKTDAIVAEYGEANVYEVSNLSTLISQHIPDHISIKNVEAKAVQEETTLEFGKAYAVKPSYEVYAPLAFAEGANIKYSDKLDGWNDDLDELELAENTYLTLTADVENKVPANLVFAVTPLGVNGTDASTYVDVNIKKGTIAASTDGTTAATSPLEIEIREKVKGGLQKLDGLSYTVEGKASYEGVTVTGVTLNAKKQTLKLNNIKVKLVGKVIGDFN